LVRQARRRALQGAKVTAIDRDKRNSHRHVRAVQRGATLSAAALSVAYDKLIIATGSNPIIIPFPATDMPGVLSYRDLDDVQAMLLAATSRGSAVIIGGACSPGGRGRPAGAGHGRHRRAPDADAHGTPARSRRPAISCNAPSKRVASR